MEGSNMSSTSTDTATRRQHGLLLHYLHMALVKCIQLMFCICIFVFGILCSVSRAADLEHVLHVVVDLPEGGPPAVLPVPALPHQAVHAARAPGRTLHPVPALKQLKFKNIFNMYYKYLIHILLHFLLC